MPIWYEHPDTYPDFMESMASPPNLNKVVVSNQSATLNWTSIAGATSYNVKYGTSSGMYMTTINTGNSNTFFTVTGLTNFTIYYFVVSAITYIETANSNEQTGSPRPLFPATISYNAPILQDLEQYYANLLIIQYKPKPKFQQTIELVSNMSLIDGLFFQLQSAFLLGSAVGAQLTIIGKIVGVPRMVFGINPYAVYFSFTRAGSEPASIGFNRATTPVDPDFFLRAQVNSTYTLTDFEMLACILLKIIYNNTYSSFSALKNALYNTFGGAIDVEPSVIPSTDGFFNFTIANGRPFSIGFNRATTPTDPYFFFRANEYQITIMSITYTVLQPYYVTMQVADFLNIVPHSSGVQQIIDYI